MPTIAAFNGIRYNTDAVDLADVTAPPYDVISASERVALEAASPYNAVRLILGPLGEETGKYKRARALLDGWLTQKILIQDEEPSITIYREHFDVDGVRRVQTGILAAVEISPEILPHERTIGPVVADRLDVIRATEANLSPVFCLYWSQHDAARRAIAHGMEAAPDADFESADGLRHQAWRVADPEAIGTIAAGLADASVVIADGHHRYRTAEAYRQERASDGPGPWDQMLLHMVDAEHEAPALLPIHRLIKDVDPASVIQALGPAFRVEPATPDAEALAAGVASPGAAGERRFALLAKDSAWIATLLHEDLATEATAGLGHCEAWRSLDVSVLHTLVFDRLLNGPEVTFAHHPHEAAEHIAAENASLAVLLAPTPPSAVREVAEAADSMPPKSTFFIPKPRTGIVMRSLVR